MTLPYLEQNEGFLHNRSQSNHNFQHKPGTHTPCYLGNLLPLHAFFFSPLSRKKERAMHFATREFFNTAQSRALNPTEKLDESKAWAKGCE